MVCAMHRLFQSEEDDRIMEGKDYSSSSRDKYDKDKKKSTKPTFRSRVMKSLSNLTRRHFTRFCISRGGVQTTRWRLRAMTKNVAWQSYIGTRTLL